MCSSTSSQTVNGTIHSVYLDEQEGVMQQLEYATLSYRTGDRAGWYLGGRVLLGSEGRDVVDVLDDLTKEGWKVTSIGMMCLLARPKPQGLAAYLTIGKTSSQ
jgi:hypothetical protein